MERSLAALTELRALANRHRASEHVAIATSAVRSASNGEVSCQTFTAVARLEQLPSVDRSTVHGARLDGQQVARAMAKLRPMSLAERAALPGIGAQRADILVAGLAILQVVHQHLGQPPILVDDYGLRDAIVQRWMATRFGAKAAARLRLRR
jgi:exopolyphosphatase/guanosine-5'-triphosphate,3'-diphosphate pyrophosphatase